MNALTCCWSGSTAASSASRRRLIAGELGLPALEVEKSRMASWSDAPLHPADMGASALLTPIRMGSSGASAASLSSVPKRQVLLYLTENLDMRPL
jgi:hypothetical protein